MSDEPLSYVDRIYQMSHLANHASPVSKLDLIEESEEINFIAFGYLRGIRDSADALEFRFRNGNSVWFPYGWLGNWKFDPSEGLLLKFSGDQVYLVLIKGSNLDKALGDTTIDMIRAGLQRHRVIWIREMSEAEIREVGGDGPTIDRIVIGEFETQADLSAWLATHAAGFSKGD